MCDGPEQRFTSIHVRSFVSSPVRLQKRRDVGGAGILCPYCLGGKAWTASCASTLGQNSSKLWTSFPFLAPHDLRLWFPQSFWHVARVWLMICSKQNLESCYCGEESVLELHPSWLCPTVHNLSVAADYMNRSPKLSTVLRRLAQGKSLVHWLDLLSKTDLHVIWVHITYMHYMRDCDVLACFISCMKSVGLWSSRPCLPESSLGVGSVLFMLLNLPSSSPSCAHKIHRCHVFFSHGWLGTPPLHWHFVQGWSGWSGWSGFLG